MAGCCRKKTDGAHLAGGLGWERWDVLVGGLHCAEFIDSATSKRARANMLGAGVGTSSEVLATEAVILTHHEEAAVTSHLVVFHHGIDGEARDLRAIHDAIGSRDGVELWDTRANEKWRSHAGIFGCAERVWDALRPKLENLIAALSGRKLRVSFVGHSLGGLILRAVACKLHLCPIRAALCDGHAHLHRRTASGLPPARQWRQGRRRASDDRIWPVAHASRFAHDQGQARPGAPARQ